MKSAMLRKRMSEYAKVLRDVVAVLDSPRHQVTSADRREVTKLLNTITDVSTLVIYHFNCRRLSAENLAEIRVKVALLADQCETRTGSSASNSGKAGLPLFSG